MGVDILVIQVASAAIIKVKALGAFVVNSNDWAYAASTASYVRVGFRIFVN